MPRADPTRSEYCASRHLLRNLDAAAELRRNPLVRNCFSPGTGRRGADSASALQRVRGLVHQSLTRCRERPQAACTRTGLGRMHAALLRCEIDRQPLAIVAAEMGLSDRQVRRERRAAHEAFLHAFRDGAADAAAATVHDTATLRLLQAAELHELGQSALATAACEALAAAPQRCERRIEALCLAAEIDLDAARYAEAALRVAEANALLARREDGLGEPARTLAAERIELTGWSLRRLTGVTGGLAAPPPRAAEPHHARDGDDEARRAVRTRALAEYALQRWEAGDGVRGAEAVRAAYALVGSLDRGRTKVRLLVMLADARLARLRGDPAAYARYFAVEQIAAARGYVRPLLLARAERIGNELEEAGGAARVLERILAPFDTAMRQTMPPEVAFAAYVAAIAERDPDAALDAIDTAERLVPPRGALGLFARARRVQLMLGARRYEDARAVAQSLRNDAEEIGNGRVRGDAARLLAAVAIAQHRRPDAERYAREALALLEQYGSASELAAIREITARLGIDRARAV